MSAAIRFRNPELRRMHSGNYWVEFTTAPGSIEVIEKLFSIVSAEAGPDGP